MRRSIQLGVGKGAAVEMFLRAGVGNAVVATFLALIAAGAGCLLGRRPAARHALWVLVLLKLVTPPLSVVPLTSVAIPGAEGRRAGGQAIAGQPDRLASNAVVDVVREPTQSAEAVDPDAGPTAAMPWRQLAATAWLAGTGTVLVLTGLRLRRWTRLLALIEPAPAELQGRLRTISARMRVGGQPSLWWFPGAAAPMLWALAGRARVIVPAALWDGLDERQRTTLLVHELAHLRRRDHWVRLLEWLATALYWWLPPVWIARRALHEAEEQCCDAWVVSLCPDDTRTYAETLLQTVDFLSESAPALPLGASGFGHVHHLKRRVIMIMRGTTPRSLDRPGFLAVLGLAALLLPLSPTWAQKDDEPGPAGKSSDLRPADSPKQADDDRPSDDDRPAPKLDKYLKARQALGIDGARGSSDAAPKKPDVGAEPKGYKQALKEKALQRQLDALKSRQLDLLRQADKELADHAADLAKQGARQAIERGLQGLAPALAKAKAEVEVARAQLAAAEARLAALSGSRKGPKPSPSLKDFDHDGAADLVKGAGRKQPGDDPRIAEIEKKLQQLTEEVKSLRGRRGASGN